MSYCSEVAGKLRHAYGLYEIIKIFSQIMPVIPCARELEGEISNLEKIAEEEGINCLEIKKQISNDEWRNSAVKSVLSGKELSS